MYIIISQNVLWKDCFAVFKIKVKAKVQKIQVIPPEQITICSQTHSLNQSINIFIAMCQVKLYIHMEQGMLLRAFAEMTRSQ